MADGEMAARMREEARYYRDGARLGLSLEVTDPRDPTDDAVREQAFLAAMRWLSSPVPPYPPARCRQP